jgi:hypothetical protein
MKILMGGQTINFFLINNRHIHIDHIQGLTCRNTKKGSYDRVLFRVPFLKREDILDSIGC